MWWRRRSNGRLSTDVNGDGDRPPPTATRRLREQLSRLGTVLLLLVLAAPLSQMHLIASDRGREGPSRSGSTVVVTVDGVEVIINDAVLAEEVMSLFGGGQGRMGRRHEPPAFHWLSSHSFVLQWVGALLFGVMVPAGIAVAQHIQESVQERRLMEHCRRGRVPLEKNLLQLSLALSRFKWEIREGDWDDDIDRRGDNKLGGDSRDVGPRSSSGDDAAYRALLVPPPGSPWVKRQESRSVGLRKVYGTCSICLETYKVNDVIVWSSNEECRDVFHERCITFWLSKKRKNDATCPCCRQPFIDKVLRSQAGFR